MRVALLTSPGRSNFDSWLDVLSAINSLTDCQVDVLTFDHWTQFRGRSSKLDERSPTLQKSYLVKLDCGSFLRSNSERLARIHSLFLHILSRVNLLPTAIKILSQRSEKVPQYDLILGDMFIFSKQPTEDLRAFLAKQNCAVFASIFHGTVDLNPFRTVHEEWLGATFSGVRIIALASSADQERGYKKFVHQLGAVFGSQEVLRLGQPRHSSDSILGKLNVSDTCPRTAIIFSRNYFDFAGFTLVDSARSLGNMLRALRASGFSHVRVRTHPNESKALTQIVIACSRLIHRVRGLKIDFKADWLIGHQLPEVAVTWFSGVSVDAVVLGIPAIELRSCGAYTLGPKVDSSWNEIYSLGMVDRATSEKELREVLNPDRLLDLHRKQLLSYQRVFGPLGHSAASQLALALVGGKN